MSDKFNKNKTAGTKPSPLTPLSEGAKPPAMTPVQQKSASPTPTPPPADPPKK